MGTNSVKMIFEDIHNRIAANAILSSRLVFHFLIETNFHQFYSVS